MIIYYIQYIITLLLIINIIYMSYFDEQYEAWMDNDCEGDITDYNPDEYWAEKLDFYE